MGSSTVMMLRLRSLSRVSPAYRVVVLPEPVGPVTSRMPCGRWIRRIKRDSLPGSMPKWRKSSRPSRLSSSRITTRSPWPVGKVETRTSTGRPATRNEIRPSCGSRFSAMSRWAMTFTRDTNSGPNARGGWSASRSTPSTRNRIIRRFSKDSM